MSDVKSLPGANFVFALNFRGQPAADIEYANQLATVTQLNKTAKSDFDFRCGQWVNEASVARAAKPPAIAPPKPVSPASLVVVRQDVDGGSWFAQIPGPIFGVCADLADPIVVVGNPGTIATPTAGPTQDQKLDGILAAVKAIQAALASQGIK